MSSHVCVFLCMYVCVHTVYAYMCVGYVSRYSQGNVATVHAMKAYRGKKLQLHSFLTSTLDAGEWSTSRPGHITPAKEP